MRSLTKKALALLLCLTVTLALVPGITLTSAPAKQAFADNDYASNYLIIQTEGTDWIEITPFWTDDTTTIRSTRSADPTSSSARWSTVESGETMLYQGRYYFEGVSINKTLYDDDDASNRWVFGASVQISGTPNALLKGSFGDPAYTGTLGANAFAYMFFQLSTIAGGVSLPSGGLNEHCYDSMFNGCTGLTSAPALPAHSLRPYCYSNMFYGCTGLHSPPALPATRLAEGCYAGMFNYCTGLTSAPALPATIVKPYCYTQMFSHCIALTQPPELPASSLAETIYEGSGDELHPVGTAYAEYCYAEMFAACEKLKTPPDLPAITLSPSCYAAMFRDSGLEVNATKTPTYTRPWRIPTSGTASAMDGTTLPTLGWNVDMLSGTAGSVRNDPALSTTYYVGPLAQPKPSFSGTLPTEYGSSATITATGSLAGAGYTVTSSDTDVAIVSGRDGGPFSVHVVGNAGSTYTISISSKGNDSCEPSSTYTSAPQTVTRANQDLPGFTGDLPTAYGASATIAPTGSAAGEGYTVTSSDANVASVSGSGDGPFTVQVVGSVGSTYRIFITAKGNDNYNVSSTFTSEEQTVGKGNQLLPHFNGTLPSARGASATITPTGSSAGEGYTVTSSDDNVATVSGSGDGPFTVQVTGDIGSTYRISITAKGNDNYKESETFSSAPQTIGRLGQDAPGFTGDLPTAYGASGVITPTGSVTGEGYTVTTSDTDVATVYGSGNGPFIVQLAGDVGSAYRIFITAKGNADYNDSTTFSSDQMTIGQADQPPPGLDGDLPTVQGNVAVITPSGSLAGAGYELSSSDSAVAFVFDNEDGTFTVQVGGNVGDSYTVSITAKGNHNYKRSSTYTSARQTVRAASEGPGPGPAPGPAPIPGLELALPQASYDYTGKAIKPVPVVSYQGQALQSGKDYSLKTSYLNNKSLGKKIASATYTVTGIGSDSFGTATQTLRFTIGLKTPEVKKVKSSKKSLKVSLKSKVKGATSYILYYSTKAKGGFKHATLKAKGKTLTLKAKLTKKKYYVKVVAYAPKAYKKLGKTKTYKAPGAKTIKLSWSKSPYAGKYRIAYKVKGTKKWSYKSAAASKSGYSLKHLKAKKKYSVAVYYQSKAFKSGYSMVNV
jgi:hypothetical protein